MKGKSLLQSFRENVTGEVQQTGFVKPNDEKLQMVSDDHDGASIYPSFPVIGTYEPREDKPEDSRINDDGTLNDVDGQIDMSKLEPRDVTADLKKHINW